MPIKTTNQGGEFELAPAGVHVARCCRIIDCGTRTDAKFGKKRRQAWIFWELPNTQRSQGQVAGTPFVVGNRYTLSHNEKATLRAHLESWYGRTFDDKGLDDAGGFDLEKLIGRPAFLNIVHSPDGKYANVRAVMPLPAGTVCPPAQEQPLVFSLSPYDPRVFEALSQGMQEHIKGSEEWQAAVNGHGRQPAAGAPADGAVEEDLPYGSPAAGAAPKKVLQPPTGGRFDDMEDDIPF